MGSSSTRSRLLRGSVATLILGTIPLALWAGACRDDAPMPALDGQVDAPADIATDTSSDAAADATPDASCSTPCTPNDAGTLGGQCTPGCAATCSTDGRSLCECANDYRTSYQYQWLVRSCPAGACRAGACR